MAGDGDEATAGQRRSPIARPPLHAWKPVRVCEIFASRMGKSPLEISTECLRSRWLASGRRGDWRAVARSLCAMTRLHLASTSLLASVIPLSSAARFPAFKLPSSPRTPGLVCLGCWPQGHLRRKRSRVNYRCSTRFMGTSRKLKVASKLSPSRPAKSRGRFSPPAATAGAFSLLAGCLHYQSLPVARNDIMAGGKPLACVAWGTGDFPVGDSES